MGSTMMLLIGVGIGLAVGLIIGFILGARARAVSALKMIGTSFRRLPFTFKSISDQDDGQNDNEEVEPDEPLVGSEELTAKMLEDLMSHEYVACPPQSSQDASARPHS